MLDSQTSVWSCLSCMAIFSIYFLMFISVCMHLLNFQCTAWNVVVHQWKYFQSIGFFYLWKWFLCFESGYMFNSVVNARIVSGAVRRVSFSSSQWCRFLQSFQVQVQQHSISTMKFDYLFIYFYTVRLRCSIILLTLKFLSIRRKGCDGFWI